MFIENCVRKMLYDFLEFESHPKLCASMCKAKIRKTPTCDGGKLCMYKFRRVVKIENYSLKQFFVFLLYRVVPLDRDNYPVLRSMLAQSELFVSDLHLPGSPGNHSCLEQYMARCGSRPVYLYFDHVDVIVDDHMLIDVSDVGDLVRRFKMSSEKCHVKLNFFRGGTTPEEFYFSLCYDLTHEDVFLSMILFNDYHSGKDVIALSSTFPGGIVNVSQCLSFWFCGGLDFKRVP